MNTNKNIKELENIKKELLKVSIKDLEKFTNEEILYEYLTKYKEQIDSKFLYYIKILEKILNKNETKKESEIDFLKNFSNNIEIFLNELKKLLYKDNSYYSPNKIILKFIAELTDFLINKIFVLISMLNERNDNFEIVRMYSENLKNNLINNNNQDAWKKIRTYLKFKKNNDKNKHGEEINYSLYAAELLTYITGGKKNFNENLFLLFFMTLINEETEFIFPEQILQKIKKMTKNNNFVFYNKEINDLYKKLKKNKEYIAIIFNNYKELKELFEFHGKKIGFKTNMYLYFYKEFNEETKIKIKKTVLKILFNGLKKSKNYYFDLKLEKLNSKENFSYLKKIKLEGTIKQLIKFENFMNQIFDLKDFKVSYIYKLKSNNVIENFIVINEIIDKIEQEKELKKFLLQKEINLKKFIAEIEYLLNLLNTGKINNHTLNKVYLIINNIKDMFKIDKNQNFKKENIEKKIDTFLKFLLKKIFTKKIIYKLSYEISNKEKNNELKNQIIELFDYVFEENSNVEINFIKNLKGKLNYDFQEFSNHVLTSLLKNKKIKLNDKELEDILNGIVETLLELTGKKNSIVMEEITVLLSIFKNNPQELKKLYLEIIKDKNIDEKNKYKYLIYKIKKLYEYDFDLSYEEFLKKFKTNSRGKIDKIFIYDNKIEGYDVTYDKSSIIDNPTNNTRSYQIIRHFPQLIDLKNKLEKKNKTKYEIEYNFLSNFNMVVEENNFSKLFYKFNQEFLPAFIKDDQLNYEELQFYKLLHENNLNDSDIKSLENLFEKFVNTNNNIAQLFTNKIKNFNKNELFNFYKDNFYKLNDIIFNNKFFELLYSTNEIKTAISIEKKKNYMKIDLNNELVYNIITNKNNFYTFVKFNKINLINFLITKNIIRYTDTSFHELLKNENRHILEENLKIFLINFNQLFKRVITNEKQYNFSNKTRKTVNNIYKLSNTTNKENFSELLSRSKEIIIELENFLEQYFNKTEVTKRIEKRFEESLNILEYFYELNNQIEHLTKNKIEKLKNKFISSKRTFKNNFIKELKNNSEYNQILFILKDKELQDIYLNFENENKENKEKFLKEINKINEKELRKKIFKDIKNVIENSNLDTKIKEKIIFHLTSLFKEIKNKGKIKQLSLYLKILVSTNFFEELEYLNLIFNESNNEVIYINELENFKQNNNFNNNSQISNDINIDF